MNNEIPNQYNNMEVTASQRGWKTNVAPFIEELSAEGKRIGSDLLDQVSTGVTAISHMATLTSRKLHESLVNRFPVNISPVEDFSDISSSDPRGVKAIAEALLPSIISLRDQYPPETRKTNGRYGEGRFPAQVFDGAAAAFLRILDGETIGIDGIVNLTLTPLARLVHAYNGLPKSAKKGIKMATGGSGIAFVASCGVLPSEAPPTATQSAGLVSDQVESQPNPESTSTSSSTNNAQEGSPQSQESGTASAVSEMATPEFFSATGGSFELSPEQQEFHTQSLQYFLAIGQFSAEGQYTIVPMADNRVGYTSNDPKFVESNGATAVIMLSPVVDGAHTVLSPSGANVWRTKFGLEPAAEGLPYWDGEKGIAYGPDGVTEVAYAWAIVDSQTGIETLQWLPAEIDPSSVTISDGSVFWNGANIENQPTVEAIQLSDIPLPADVLAVQAGAFEILGNNLIHHVENGQEVIVLTTDNMSELRFGNVNGTTLVSDHAIGRVDAPETIELVDYVWSEEQQQYLATQEYLQKKLGHTCEFQIKVRESIKGVFPDTCYVSADNVSYIIDNANYSLMHFFAKNTIQSLQSRDDYPYRLGMSPEEILSTMVNASDPEVLNPFTLPVVIRVRGSNNQYPNGELEYRTFDPNIPLEFRLITGQIRASVGYGTSDLKELPDSVFGTPDSSVGISVNEAGGLGIVMYLHENRQPQTFSTGVDHQNGRHYTVEQAIAGELAGALNLYKYGVTAANSGVNMGPLYVGGLLGSSVEAQINLLPNLAVSPK